MINAFILTCLLTHNLNGNLPDLVPLNKEDSHFFHYRMLLIDASLFRTKEYILSLEIEENVKEKILCELYTIDYNLGKRE